MLSQKLPPKPPQTISVTGSPEEVERELIEEDLTNLSGVAGVHGLHIWSLTMDRNVISVHLSVGEFPGVKVFRS